MRSNAMGHKVSTTGRQTVFVEKDVEKYSVYFNYFESKGWMLHCLGSGFCFLSAEHQADGI